MNMVSTLVIFSDSHVQFAWGLLATCLMHGKSSIKRCSSLLPLQNSFITHWSCIDSHHPNNSSLRLQHRQCQRFIKRRWYEQFIWKPYASISLGFFNQTSCMFKKCLVFCFQIWILCNDCGTTSNVQFHIVAHKCPGCSSYNTRQTRGAPAACSRVWEQGEENNAVCSLKCPISCSLRSVTLHLRGGKHSLALS